MSHTGDEMSGFDWLKCPKCSYDLRGLPKNRCPECGTPFNPAELKSRFQDEEYKLKKPRILALVGLHLLMSILFVLAFISGEYSLFLFCMSLPVAVGGAVYLPILLHVERNHISNERFRRIFVLWIIGCMPYFYMLLIYWNILGWFS